ncbi:MAG: hypothetical protein AAF939_19040 [Planctomycetota bacterium]
MRPCNQCGTPIENNEIICASCEKLNLDSGYQPKVSIRPFGPDNPAKDPEPIYTTSLGHTSNVFLTLCVFLGALSGFLLGGGPYIVLGFAICSLIISFVFVRLMI